MEIVDSARRLAEKLIGDTPSAEAVGKLVRQRKAISHAFADDGETPNNSLPLIQYRSPLILRDWNPAAIFEVLFESHGWGGSWRDGICEFNHFHTRTHEVLGVARGGATVQFGGAKGKQLKLRAGDVVIIPAGVGHRRLATDGDLLVVGAYPGTGNYDEPKSTDIDHAEALKRIKATPLPLNDPVYGRKGPLRRLWT